MKKLLSVLGMLLAPFLPSATVTNKRNEDHLPVAGHTDSTEMREAHNIFDEAMEMAIAARRVEEDMVYKSCGLSRPNSENRYVITMNADGTYDASAEKDPHGTKFTPVSEKDRQAYNDLTKHALENPTEMIREKGKVYTFKDGKFDEND